MKLWQYLKKLLAPNADVERKKGDGAGYPPHRVKDVILLLLLLLTKQIRGHNKSKKQALEETNINNSCLFLHRNNLTTVKKAKIPKARLRKHIITDLKNIPGKNE